MLELVERTKGSSHLPSLSGCLAGTDTLLWVQEPWSDPAGDLFVVRGAHRSPHTLDRWLAFG